MPGNFKKTDLRSLKTRTALQDSMWTLLKKQRFAKITVNDLCEEARISRAAFYTHYNDKYDLLAIALTSLKNNSMEYFYNNKDAAWQDVINHFLFEKKNIIANLVEESNAEIHQLFIVFVSSFLKLFKENYHDTEYDNIVLCNFFAGGIVNLILWQVRNNFPPESLPLTPYLSKLVIRIIHNNTDEEDER